jgi:predicted DNA-binding WGR domain protein
MNKKRKGLSEAREKLEQAKSILERLQSDKQQSHDAAAESLKYGRRGQQAEASLKALQETADAIQEAIDRLDVANEVAD